MNLSQTAKACVLSLAIVPLVGTSFDFDFSTSRWIVPVCAVLILLPIVILVAKQLVHSKREYNLPPPQPSPIASDRISNRLVVLSSAAVLAIYSAGYFRTREAADRLAQRVTRQAATNAALVLPAPAQAASVANDPTQVPDTTSPQPKKNSSGSPASSEKPTAKPKRAPARETASDDDQNDSGAPTTPANGTPRTPRDGRYQGRGSSPHGDIIAEVVIQRGRIVYAGIADCLTRYSCSVIKELPEQIVTRQSTEVDVVSGATESTQAFQDGIAAALLRAIGGK
jgi:uncharacterized protein with FMN-binding domain